MGHEQGKRLAPDKAHCSTQRLAHRELDVRMSHTFGAKWVLVSGHRAAPCITPLLPGSVMVGDWLVTRGQGGFVLDRNSQLITHCQVHSQGLLPVRITTCICYH